MDAVKSSYDDYGSGTDYPDYSMDPQPCRLDPNPVDITVQTYIHSFICAFGLLGNTLVVVTYTFYKKAKTMTDVYLLNVALADLLFVVALPLIIYNEQHDWAMGAAACKALRGVYSVNLYSGMLLLACVSGDRYVAIVQARRFFGARSKHLTYSRLVCVAIWASAAALSVPTVVYTERFEENDLLDPTVTVMCQSRFSHNETAKLMKVFAPSLQVAMGFLLPLLIMVFCYASIVHTLQRAQSTQRHKAIRVVLAVVVVFVLCHLPYNVVLLTHTLSLFELRSCEAETIKLRCLAATRSVAYLHCCLNPVLYAFVGKKFRSHFREIVRDLWCLGKRYIYFGRASLQTSDVYISGRRSMETQQHHDNGSSFTA